MFAIENSLLPEGWRHACDGLLCVDFDFVGFFEFHAYFRTFSVAADEELEVVVHFLSLE